MQTIAIIQARTGSKRLPGKVMYPLAGKSIISHVVDRVRESEKVNKVVIATSNRPQDDVLADTAQGLDIETIRGDEEDVLQRYKLAIERYEPDITVRITGDCPLIDPDIIDRCIKIIKESDADYVTNILERSFPRGLDVEVFTRDSFGTVYSESTESRHFEHVTPYYREHPSKFELRNVSAQELYDDPMMRDRTDLRLTVDEPDDYKLLCEIYNNLYNGKTINIHEVVDFIAENNLSRINEDVPQKDIEQ